jgi:hypothetical protein
MKEFTDPKDYFPYIGHELNHKKILKSPIWKNIVGNLMDEENISYHDDDARVYCKENRSVLKNVLVRNISAQRNIAEDIDSVNVIVPRHRSLFDYCLGMPAHFILINRAVMLVAGSNLFVARYDSILRYFGGMMFLREDAIIKRRGRTGVYLSIKRYIDEVLPAYLKREMFDGIGDLKLKHDMIVYPGQEKDSLTRKRKGGRSKSGKLRDLSPIFFILFRNLTAENGTKLFITPANISFSKYPDAIFLAHPTKWKGIFQNLRYLHEQNFTMGWYPKYTRRHTEARLDAVVNYGKPEQFCSGDFKTMRDIIDYSHRLKEKIGLLESIFPTTLLYRAMDNDSELSLPELENRAKKLFDRYCSLGVYLEKVSGREGEMAGIREIVDRAMSNLNCNPRYRMFHLETSEFLRAKSGRLFSLDPRLHQWYANNIRHLDV